MPNAGGAAPSIVLKGGASGEHGDAGLAQEAELRLQVHHLQTMLPKCAGAGKGEHEAAATESYKKIKGYSLANAHPGAQCVDSAKARTRTSLASSPAHFRCLPTLPHRTQLVAAAKAVLAEAKKIYATLD